MTDGRAPATRVERHPGATAGVTGASADDLPVGDHHHHQDRGSIAPLILGLMGALLLLSVGIIAGGSAFLANQRLQGLCDGAVAAAVGALDPRRTSAAGASSGDALAAADQYLAVRGPDVRATVRIGARSVSATCRNTAEVALGAVFGTPTVDQSVTADSEPFQRGAPPATPVDPAPPSAGSPV